MLSTIITSLCLGINFPQYNSVCNSLLTATSIELHIKSDLEMYQDKIVKISDKEVDNYIGKTNKEMILGTAMIINIYKTQTFIFHTSLKPIADDVSGNFNNSNYNLQFTWTF